MISDIYKISGIYKMCLDCLKKNVDECSENIEYLNNQINNLTCECCKSVPNALLTISCAIKAYGLIKIKKHTIGCNDKLMELENITKQRIINLLNNMIENIDNQKDDVSDGAYLRLMNNVNELNKYFKDFDNIENDM